MSGATACAHSGLAAVARARRPGSWSAVSHRRGGAAARGASPPLQDRGGVVPPTPVVAVPAWVEVSGGVLRELEHPARSKPASVSTAARRTAREPYRPPPGPGGRR